MNLWFALIISMMPLVGQSVRAEPRTAISPTEQPVDGASIAAVAADPLSTTSRDYFQKVLCAVPTMTIDEKTKAPYVSYLSFLLSVDQESRAYCSYNVLNVINIDDLEQRPEKGTVWTLGNELAETFADIDSLDHATNIGKTILKRGIKLLQDLIGGRRLPDEDAKKLCDFCNWLQDEILPWKIDLGNKKPADKSKTSDILTPKQREVTFQCG